jgi:hypothetical protein
MAAVIVNNGSSANPISTKPKPHDLALNNPVHRHLFPPRQGLKRRKYRTSTPRSNVLSVLTSSQLRGMEYTNPVPFLY